jgi:tRNA threonylcarbamoyladenosine biosynthesis protein TsaE
MESAEITLESELPALAEKLSNTFSLGEPVCFVGEMGVGKTTFIKRICQHLGVTDSISSPTYSIVNEYKTAHFSIFHFDLYRVNSPEELMDIGFEEYLENPKAYCFIEWPDKAGGLIPDKCVEIRMSKKNDKRLIEWRKHK